jgi:hypothetical protein
MAAMQCSMQAVLGLSGETHHLHPLSDQGAQLAHFRRRDPNAFQPVGGQQLGQGEGCNLVGHDARFGDSLDVRWMDNDYRLYTRQQSIVYFPSIGGHFDHNRISIVQVVFDPAIEAFPGRTPGTEDRVLLAIDASSNEVVFVDVKGDETFGLGRRTTSFQGSKTGNYVFASLGKKGAGGI